MKTRKYMNPYLAGFLLGLLLLTTIYITGRGLGASGALKSAVVKLVQTVAPEHASTAPFYVEFKENNPEGPLRNWLVFEVVGLLIGAFFSGVVSNRVGLKFEKGPLTSNSTRLIAAIIGGFLFGYGSQLGRGCTSGSALSGMAVMSFGGIITMMAIFGSGYALAYFFRKLWIK
ncbi:MAG: YeeE/YedE family protein [Prolixibacteraceae bacterium]|nr:YeeE/YedE family protein [Prolixibacteraceae bacterium]